MREIERDRERYITFLSVVLWSDGGVESLPSLA
jgi:hypothetical protein